MNFFAHSLEGKPVEEWHERVERLRKWFIRMGLSHDLGENI